MQCCADFVTYSLAVDLKLPLTVLEVELRCFIRIIIIFRKSEYIEKYQFELCAKYDREHNFDIIPGYIIPCCKVETPDKPTIFVGRQNSFDKIHCKTLMCHK